MAQPVTIRCGITDGSKTEVISGLEENAAVITTVTLSTESSPSGTGNPFGGMRRF